MKRKFTWQWLIGLLFIGIVAFLPTETTKAAVEYSYEFNEKEKGYYIEFAWGQEDVTELELPTTYKGYPVVGIEKYAFAYWQDLKKLTIPTSYKTIEGWAFYRCYGLEEIVLNAKIKTIKPYTFLSCSSLKKITLPNTLKTIESQAFYHCGIETITIPKSVKEIENYAFSYCPNLYQIIVKSNDIEIGSNTFYNVLEDYLTIIADKGSDAYFYAKKLDYATSLSTEESVELVGSKMYVGEKKKVMVCNSKQKPTLKTSNKKVIAVTDGYLTAKKTGTATITVQLNGKSYKYKIKVVKRTEKNVLDIVWSTYVTKDMSDYEKVIATNYWICQNITYDYDNFIKDTIPKTSYTTKGVLETGRAICDGYTKVFNKIIEHYGIPIERVVGKVNDSTSGSFEAHAWNLVKIGKYWYHVDSTWNDPVGDHLPWDYVGDDYLLLSNREIGHNHIWNKEQYPEGSKKALDKTITTVNKNGLTINANEKTLKVGKSATLKVGGTKKKVTWSSSNKKIVTVNSKGKITAKKAGTAKIYCKVGGKKYAIKITVEK